MQMQLTYSERVVGYVEKPIRKEMQKVVKARKREKDYSESQFIEEALKEKLERERSNPLEPQLNGTPR